MREDFSLRQNPINAFTVTVATIILLRGAQGWLTRQDIAWTAMIPDVLTGFLAALVLFRIRRGTRLTAGGVGAVLFVCASAVSGVIVATQEPQLALFGFRALALAVLTVLLVQLALPTASELRVISKAMLLILAANFVVGISQAIFGYSTSDLEALAEAGSTFVVGSQFRLAGLQASGQDFAVLSGATTAWGIAQVARFGFGRVSTLSLAVTALSAVTTTLALQRGALVGLALSVVVTLIMSLAASNRISTVAQTFRRGIVLGLSFVAGLWLVALWAPAQASEAISRLLSLFSLGRDYSFQVRQATTLPTTLDLLNRNPWGYGVGASGPVAAQFAADGPLSAYPLGGIAADNGYLFVALQLGVFGAILFVVMLLGWAVSGRLVSDDGLDRWAGTSVITFLIGAMLTGSYWGLASTITLVLILGILSAAPEVGRRESESASGRRAARRPKRMNRSNP